MNTSTAKQAICNWYSRILQSFRRIFTYKGRATRAEFWGFFLLYTVYDLALRGIYALGKQLSPVHLYYLGANSETGAVVIQGCTWAISIIFQLTLLSLTVRRLRDAGVSVFWVAIYPLMNLVTYLIVKYVPGEIIVPLGGADEPTTVFITISWWAIASQFITSLSYIAILILCLRKSRPLEQPPAAQQSES